MRRRGATATADEVEPVLGDIALNPTRHLLGAERIMRLPVDEFRQPRIGLHRDQAAPVGGEPADVLRHLLRSGRAIQAHQRHVERIDDRRGGGDVGPDKQRACRLPPSPARKMGVSAPASRRAILAPLTAALICSVSWQVLDEDCVHTAGDEATALLRQGPPPTDHRRYWPRLGSFVPGPMLPTT